MSQSDKTLPETPSALRDAPPLDLARHQEQLAQFAKGDAPPLDYLRRAETLLDYALRHWLFCLLFTLFCAAVSYFTMLWIFAPEKLP